MTESDLLQRCQFQDASDRGVDVLVEKLRTSKQTCEEIKKLYEIR